MLFSGRVKQLNPTDPNTGPYFIEALKSPLLAPSPRGV
jgi:hypothetical protein